MFPLENGLGRALLPRWQLSFAMMPPPGGAPRGFDRAPLPDTRRVVAMHVATLITERNDRAVNELGQLDPKAADYATRRQEILEGEREDILFLIQPHMPDLADASPTLASETARYAEQRIADVNALRQRDLEHARTITSTKQRTQEIANIQDNRRNEIADILSFHMNEPVITRPRAARRPRQGAPRTAATPAAGAPAPWPGGAPAPSVVDRTMNFVGDQYHQNIVGNDNGRRWGCGCLTGLALAGLLGGTIALGSGWHPFGIGAPATPTPNKPTPTATAQAHEAGPVSLAANTCATIPANTVLMGDVNEGGHIVSGQIVGGQNLYDTGPGSDQTGLVTVTTQPVTICAEWGASGDTFSNLDDAKKKAATDKSNMEASGCGPNGCRRGVTIVYVP